MMLTVLQCCGVQLRSDDASSMKVVAPSPLVTEINAMPTFVSAYCVTHKWPCCLHGLCFLSFQLSDNAIFNADVFPLVLQCLQYLQMVHSNRSCGVIRPQVLRSRYICRSDFVSLPVVCSIFRNRGV